MPLRLRVLNREKLSWAGVICPVLRIGLHLAEAAYNLVRCAVPCHAQSLTQTLRGSMAHGCQSCVPSAGSTSDSRPQMWMDLSSEADANIWWSMGFQDTAFTVPEWPSSCARSSPVALCHTYTCRHQMNSKMNARLSAAFVVSLARRQRSGCLRKLTSLCVSKLKSLLFDGGSLFSSSFNMVCCVVHLQTDKQA